MRFAVTLLLLLACVPPENPPPAQPAKPKTRPVALQEYRGVYSVGDEKNAFYPCGSKERWWVAFRSGSRPDSVTGWGNWSMRVRGTVSPKGSYGHLGSYSRTLTIEQVLEVNSGRGNPCGP